MKLPVIDLWTVLLVALVLLLAARVLVGILPLRLSGRAEARVIRVIGVGGGGCNAVDAMIRARVRGVAFIACNTDAQALRHSNAARKIQIGDTVTHGLGSGGDPAVGREAAEADTEKIAAAVAGADLVFVAAGLGGGTGSGAAPIVAGMARERGALTVGVVTKPFGFEGPRRAIVADQAATELERHVDALITIPNDRLNGIVADGASILDAFRTVDDVLRESVQAIVEVITVPGLVNLDFADVRAILKDGGSALIGIGRAAGEDRAREAARQAIANPLVEHAIDGAHEILMSVTGASTLGLTEVTRAAEAVRAAADPAANMIFGAGFDERLGDVVRVMVLATGFDRHDERAPVVETIPDAAEDRGSDGAAPGQALSAEPGRPRGRRKAAPRPDTPHTAVGAESDPPGGSLPAKTGRPTLDPDMLEVPSFLRLRPIEASDWPERGTSAKAAQEKPPS